MRTHACGTGRFLVFVSLQAFIYLTLIFLYVYIERNTSHVLSAYQPALAAGHLTPPRRPAQPRPGYSSASLALLHLPLPPQLLSCCFCFFFF